MTSMTFRRSVQSVLGLAAAALLATDVVAAKSTVPFNATIVVTELLLPGPPGCPFVGVISGTGQATHSGNSSLSSLDCVIPIGPTTFSFSSSQVVLTASNGDQVFATYSGTLDVSSGVGVIVGTYQVTGGTGRFTGATGGGSVRGLEDISTNPANGIVELTGTISY